MMQVDSLVFIGRAGAKYIIDNMNICHIYHYIAIIIWLIIMMLVDGIYWEGGCQIYNRYK